MAIIDKEILDKLLQGYEKPEDLLGKDGILKNLTKALVERVLEAEMTHHLGYEKHAQEGRNKGNSRNGHTSKKVISDDGPVPLTVPRDRDGTFEPIIVRKGQRRFTGFDDKVISMYARGMTVREIQGHLEEIYGVDVSPTLISTVTDAVIEEVRQWQSRPLDPLYPILFLDALVVKVRDNGATKNKSIYLALGVNMDGDKELLGLWIADTEGAKFWLHVLTELRNRGVEDVLIACVDGLKGFPEAIEATFPLTKVQLCIIHMIRNSLRFVSWKDEKAVVADLKRIYRAATVEEAGLALSDFASKWDDKYPSISKSWQSNWPNLTHFFAYPPEIRKVIYTTNAIESLNRSLRKIIKSKGAFPNDEAVTKVLYLALKNASKKWTRPLQNWKAAINRFAIEFEGRVPLA